MMEAFRSGCGKSAAKRMRFGIIGCGDAAKRLFVPGLQGSSRAELTAVSSRDVDKAKVYAKQFSCAHTLSYEELLNREDIDVVYIALPIGLHVPWALRALEKGKHVYCEKSLAPTLGEVEQILKCAQRFERRVMEGFMYRFHTLHSTVLQILDSGQLGRLHSFVGSFGFSLSPNDALRRDPAMAMGALNELGCYTVSAARNFFGSFPSQVRARLNCEEGRDISGSAYLNFDSGDAYCEFGFDRSYRCRYSLWGSNASLSVERSFTPPPSHEPVVHLVSTTGEEMRRVKAENHFSRAIDAFCDAIENNSGFDVFEGDAYEQAVIMEALRRSVQEKKPVETAQLRPQPL